jgi:hypothetical protein
MNNKFIEKNNDYIKYLKYKNKYYELKQTILTNKIGGSNLKSWYNLDNKKLYITSDLEGGNPFREFETNNISLEIKNKMNSIFEFKDGLIVNFNSLNTAFAFTGDLLDNNTFSIRLLIQMIKLKEKYPDRVILIGGNRDFNKIRMGVELFIYNNNLLPWDNTNSLSDLITQIKSGSNFEFRQEEVPEYLKDVLKPWTDNMEQLKEVFNNKKEFYKRIITIYQKTLGIPTLDFMIEELKQMFNDKLESLTNDEMAILLCIIHMVMSFEWTQLPSYLKIFNGLYVKYLSYCHVIAGFKINNKNGILSHGSMPINTTDGINRKLTAPFGYDSSKIKNKKSLIDILILIEQEKSQLIKEYILLKDTIYDYNKNPIFTKFIHLTAPTKDENNPEANSTYSPIVWNHPIETLTDIKLHLSGGNYSTWIKHDKEHPIYSLEDGYDTIHYNIYGHAPSYYNPTYYRKEFTLHVNLDISKIEGPSNSYSFALLVISPSATYLLGRIRFLQLDKSVKDGENYNFIKNTGYETEQIKKELAGKSHWYKVIIPEIGSVELLKTDKIPGTNYYVKSLPNFNKLISNNL